MIIVLLFVLMFLLMAMGLPIALAIGLPAIGLIITPGVFPDTIAFSALGQTVVQQLFSGIDSFDLLAVPLFMRAALARIRPADQRAVARREVASATRIQQ